MTLLECQALADRLQYFSEAAALPGPDYSGVKEDCLEAAKQLREYIGVSKALLTYAENNGADTRKFYE